MKEEASKVGEPLRGLGDSYFRRQLILFRLIALLACGVDFIVCIPENGLQQFVRNLNEFIKNVASLRSKN